MRRGQIEIVGLLIIVIMISFMLLFLVTCDNSGSYGSKKYMPQTISSRFVGSMLKTTSMCVPNMAMRDLIIDCARNAETGGSMDLVCEDGQMSCGFMKSVLDSMLNSSFDNLSVGYEFMVLSPANKRLYYRNCTASDGCTAKTYDSGDAWNQPLPVGYQGTMNIRMCMGKCG
jgi:hypothetical protein